MEIITASPKPHFLKTGMKAKKGFKLPLDGSEAVESLNTRKPRLLKPRKLINSLLKRQLKPIKKIGLDFDQESTQRWNPLGTAITLGVLSVPYLMEAGGRLALFASELSGKSIPRLTRKELESNNN